MPVVLVAEDEFLIRALLIDALADVGLDCLEAPTRKAALDFIASDKQIDALVVVTGLRVRCGARFSEAARGQRRGLRTGRCRGMAGEPGPEGGMHFFPRPYTPLHLPTFGTSVVSGAAKS